MPKLSTIDELEQAAAQASDELEMQEAQETLRAAQAPAEHAPAADDAAHAPMQADEPEQARASVVEHGADTQESAQSHVEPEPIEARAARRGAPLTAAEEEDFHGLSSTEGMGVGQKVLIALAVVVCVAAVLYVVNSWVHFI